jgi:hypothetical protein
MTEMPPLPPSLQTNPDTISPGEFWLDAYVTRSKQITPMAPHAFHLSAGLAILSTIVARRVVVNAWYGDRYPNLFIMWVAPSTIFKKSSTLDTASKILYTQWPYLLAPANITPEALVEIMAGKKPINYDELSQSQQEDWLKEAIYAGQKAFVVDECSGFLGSTRRDYNQGLVELLLKLYDCTPEYSRQTRGKGRETIRNAYLTFLGASTPQMMAPFIADPLNWTNGLLPRFLFALAPPEKPLFNLGNNEHDVDDLVPHLKRMDQKLPQRTTCEQETSVRCEMAPEAITLLQDYYKFTSYDAIDSMGDNEGLKAAYGRLHEHVLKIATLLATCDWADTDISHPEMSEGHLLRAIQIMETFRSSLHTLVDNAHRQQKESMDQKVLAGLGKAGPAGLTHRDLYKNFSLPADEVRASLERLVRSGQVRQSSRSPDGNGGRPTTYYHLGNAA